MNVTAMMWIAAFVCWAFNKQGNNCDNDDDDEEMMMTGPDNDDSGHNKNDSLDGYDDPGLAVQSVCLFVCLFICLF